MAAPVLIYCASGNQRFAEIAVANGFEYGGLSDDTNYLTPMFLDLNYKRPDFPRHLAAAKRYRPRFVVAGDIDKTEEMEGVLIQADALRRYSEEVIVVPKQTGMIDQIPDWCIIGYSVPTRFGASQAAQFELIGRRLHLLGGNPQRQMQMWRYFGSSIISVDGNSHHQAAVRWGTFWEKGKWVSKEAAAARVSGPDSHYRAFEISCRNISSAWASLAETGLQATYL